MLEGGSNSLLSLVSSTHLVNYQSIAGSLNIKDEFDNIPDTVFGAPFNLAQLMKDFLDDKGVPCPEKWEQCLPYFDSAIDVGDVDKPWFRPRMFAWAATGFPSLKIDGETIDVSNSGCVLLTPSV